MFLDDLAEMSFYRLVRWSQARVTVHSGREVYFDDKHAPVFPCRAQYEQDNETLKGIRAGKDFIDRDTATYGDSDDEFAPTKRRSTWTRTQRRVRRRVLVRPL